MTLHVIVERIGRIICPEDLPNEDGGNINGPSCIEVPEWCEDRLGRYYLYFAHHRGQYIRMAYSDFIGHGWQIYEGGVLDLRGFEDAHDHCASPDVLIDHDARELLLYFHAPSTAKQQQWTYVAASRGGLSFNKISDEPLAAFYLRAFRWRGFVYGMTKGGNLWRSTSGVEPFESGPNPFDPRLSDEIWHNDKGSIRHVALKRAKETMYVFYTCIGDRPERIYCSLMDISDTDWFNWTVSDRFEVMRPTEAYEGAGIRLRKSQAGAAHEPENALRDPYLMTVGRTSHLFYSVQGEQGIAVCEVTLPGS